MWHIQIDEYYIILLGFKGCEEWNIVHGHNEVTCIKYVNFNNTKSVKIFSKAPKCSKSVELPTLLLSRLFRISGRLSTSWLTALRNLRWCNVSLVVVDSYICVYVYFDSIVAIIRFFNYPVYNQHGILFGKHSGIVAMLELLANFITFSTLFGLQPDYSGNRINTIAVLILTSMGEVWRINYLNKVLHVPLLGKFQSPSLVGP